MMRGVVLLAALAALAGCGSPASDRTGDAGPSASQQPEAPVNPGLDQAALESRDCAAMMGFYAEAIQAGDFASAERVWKKDLLPPGGLAGQFGAFRMPKLAAGETREEGAAGSLYCEVAVTLTDAGDPRQAPRQGTITFRRVNDVPGATPEQLRWHIEKSAIEGIGESVGKDAG